MGTELEALQTIIGQLTMLRDLLEIMVGVMCGIITSFSFRW